MTVPEGGSVLTVSSLGKKAGLLVKDITSVELLGSKDKLQWEQEDTGLQTRLPSTTNDFRTSICFKLTLK